MAFWRCAVHGLLGDDRTIELTENDRRELLLIPLKACASCRRPVMPASGPY